MPKVKSIPIERGLRIFRTTYTDANGDSHAASKWYVEFRFGMKPRRVPAFTDKTQSIDLARNIRRLVNVRESGRRLNDEHQEFIETMPATLRQRLVEIQLLEPLAAMVAHQLGAHVDAWEKYLLSRGNTPDYARLRAYRVREVFAGCEFAEWSDLDAPGTDSTILAFLATLQQREKKPITTQTLAYYISALKGFGKWMVRDKRAKYSPLESLQTPQHVDVDRKHERRALTLAEMIELLKWTAASVERFEMPAAERARLYRFAFESGLRPGQLRSLTVGSFDLDASPATVSASAAYVKRKKRHTQPITPAMADELRKVFASKMPAAPAFDLPRKDQMAEMFYADLAEARQKWIEAAPKGKQRAERQKSDFLAQRDRHNLVADFYSLRHTTGTHLSDAGLPQKTIQTWLHHTQAKTTERYLHEHRETAQSVLAIMPNLAATGTTGKALGASLGAFAGRNPSNLDGSGQLRTNAGKGQKAGKSVENAKKAGKSGRKRH